MTLENSLRGTGDLAAMCDQVYGIRKNERLHKHGQGPMEIELINLKDREMIGELTEIKLRASRKTEAGSLTSTISVIHETGDFQVVGDVETITSEIKELVALVKENPKASINALAKELNQTEYFVETKLEKLGWHRARGGAGGGSPWHQDEGKPCPYTKNDDMAKIETKVKKTPDDAVKFLREQLTDTRPDGEYVFEDNLIEAWHRREGIAEGGEDAPDPNLRSRGRRAPSAGLGSAWAGTGQDSRGGLIIMRLVLNVGP